MSQALEAKDGNGKSVGKSKTAFARLLSQGSSKGKLKSQTSTSDRNGSHRDPERDVDIESSSSKASLHQQSSPG